MRGWGEAFVVGKRAALLDWGSTAGGSCLFVVKRMLLTWYGKLPKLDGVACMICRAVLRGLPGTRTRAA